MKVLSLRKSAIFLKRLVFGVASFLALGAAIHAATLSDYKKRVDDARIAADELFENRGTAAESLQLEMVEQIEKLVPANEKIDWPGGSIETANRWLKESLDALKTETDAKKRGAILTEISERLHAIAQAVEELEASVAATQSKDENKQKLAEILRRVEYQKPQPKEPSFFQRWLNAFLEWLSKVWPSNAPDPSAEAGSGLGALQFWLQILVYAIVIGLVAFLVYKFAPFLSRRFSDRDRKERGDRVILGERITSDESASSLFRDAERLAREGDLRGAIRKGYIALLCDLGDRKVVRLARHKTNRDYLRDVRKNDRLFENMTGITRDFENNWYGLRAAELQDWEDFRRKYKEVAANP